MSVSDKQIRGEGFICTLSPVWIGLRNSPVSQEHSVHVSVCVLKGVALNEVYNTFQCSRLKGVSLQ